MSRAETLAGLTEAIAGHTLEEHAAGNGYTEPREAWAVCTCGADIAEWQQFYNESDYDPERDFPAHVAAVALAWLEGHGWAEQKPAPTITNCRHDPACRDWWPNGRSHSQRCMEENMATVETGEDA